jgi:hypothetical protein
MIELTLLEQYIQLMKKYNVELLEVEGCKLYMKASLPEMAKPKITLDKLDKIAAMPSNEELEMYHHNVAPSNPVFAQMTRTNKVK